MAMPLGGKKYTCIEGHPCLFLFLNSTNIKVPFSFEKQLRLHIRVFSYFFCMVLL